MSMYGYGTPLPKIGRVRAPGRKKYTLSIYMFTYMYILELIM